MSQVGEGHIVLHVHACVHMQHVLVSYYIMPIQQLPSMLCKHGELLTKISSPPVHVYRHHCYKWQWAFMLYVFTHKLCTLHDIHIMECLNHPQQQQTISINSAYCYIAVLDFHNTSVNASVSLQTNAPCVHAHDCIVSFYDLAYIAVKDS